MTTKSTLEIKVSGKTHCNDLANSIVAAYTEGKEIVLLAIGPAPVSQAYKSVCVANRQLASRGIILVIIPGLVMKDMPDLKNPGNTVQWVVSRMRLRDFLMPVNQESPHEDISTTPEKAPDARGDRDEDGKSP